LTGANIDETMDLIRGLFRHWETIGHAFLKVGSNDDNDRMVVDIKKLAVFYEIVKDMALRRTISESFEVLLDRMAMNIGPSSPTEPTVVLMMARSLVCLAVWMTQRHPDDHATNNSTRIWPSILTRKFIQVISRFFDTATHQMQQVMIETLSRYVK
jgi:hypothetical protein